MRRVLFVGQDQPLWQEIRANSPEFSKQWSSEFRQNAREALALADDGNFDAVVADVQLCDMSGVELLDEFMRRQPQAFRLVLSEQGDLQSTVRCIGKAHHHLLKPCDAAMVADALNQGLGKTAWTPPKAAQDLIGKLRWVPSPPNVYFQIALEMESPAASVETIGKIIAQDPPTTAKVLQLANSAVFGLHMQVNEPAEAVAYLGLEATRTLVLLAHTFSEFDRLPKGGFSVDELWYHSVLVGQLARHIVCLEEQGSELGEQAYAAGLLHDLGKVLFAANLPEPFGQALQLSKAGPMSLHIAERHFLGASHAEVGACLLGIWNLPAPIVQAVGLHHQPSGLKQKSFGVLTAVHAADVFARAMAPAQSGARLPELDLIYLGQLGLIERADFWRKQCEEKVAAVDGV
ncbi:MAG TPA: response regulator [Verrucomicrobiae bacterium]|nr:response regulator [Verrucomicrobiae bacterium]